LKITIHRGGRQIGGCITEIETNEDHRIFIDLGENLSSNNEEGTEDPWKAKVNALKANAVFLHPSSRRPCRIVFLCR